MRLKKNRVKCNSHKAKLAWDFLEFLPDAAQLIWVESDAP
jgi:hypothetical protein